MKILDRYVIISFIKNYCISFMVLVGMYVVLDMVFNFNNLVQFQQQGSAVTMTWWEMLIGTLRGMGDYYFYQCFLFFVHLSGIIPVVAAAFTLMRLSRFNELTAMLAAGVPLLRIATPIVIVALLLNALLLVDQELLIPNMIPKLVRDHDEVNREAKNWFDIPFMQDAKDGLVHVSRYYPHGDPSSTDHDSRPMMLVLDVIERRPVTEIIDGKKVENLRPYAHLKARKAFWHADPDPLKSTWELVNGERVTGIDPNEPHSSGAESDSSGESQPTTYDGGNITPEEISLYRSGNYVDMLSTQRINELLDRPKSFGRLSLLRVKHSRFTQPLMNVILLLMAIPCVLTREPGRLKSGATKCLMFMGLGLGSVFLTAQIAANPPTGAMLTNLMLALKMRPDVASDFWAALMAWLPIFIFGPLSVYLLGKIKT